MINRKLLNRTVNQSWKNVWKCLKMQLWWAPHISIFNKIFKFFSNKIILIPFYAIPWTACAAGARRFSATVFSGCNITIKTLFFGCFNDICCRYLDIWIIMWTCHTTYDSLKEQISSSFKYSTFPHFISTNNHTHKDFNFKCRAAIQFRGKNTQNNHTESQFKIFVLMNSATRFSCRFKNIDSMYETEGNKLNDRHIVEEPQ